MDENRLKRCLKGVKDTEGWILVGVTKRKNGRKKRLNLKGFCSPSPVKLSHLIGRYFTDSVGEIQSVVTL